jgi:SAM-dependent methyltransferase
MPVSPTTGHVRKRWLLNVSRIHLRRFNEDFAATVRPGALVLDAGAGTAPYRSLFEHARYETADFEKLEKEYHPSTYVCDLASIPVEDGRFDHVVFNQVLEHVPEPAAVLSELHRVLKPGGTMICSCPLFYEEHERPYDFYRYTQFGLRYLFEKTGFEVERLEWLEGYFGTLAHQLHRASRYLPLKPSRYSGGLGGWLALPMLAALKLTLPLIAGVLYRLDVSHKYTERGLPKNYVAFVRKPE